MKLSVLYRGPLSSCNYGCDYCPFAKTRNTRVELADDARKLHRFIDWIADHPQHTFKLLFTPWGEALIRRYYQQGMIRLSHLPQVEMVAAQTNLSFSTRWLTDCLPRTTRLWTTYHPSQTTLLAFLRKCRELDRIGIVYSVGVVGLKENFADIDALRQELAPHIYLWVNAYKRKTDYYTAQDMDFLEQTDPFFSYNTQYYATQGKPCRTGHSVCTVDGNGDMYRCHFIKMSIGNIYTSGFEKNLFPRLCTLESCGCHIGYAHLEELKLDEVFQGGELERIPYLKNSILTKL